MIIHDGDFRRSALLPAEDNPPLVIDADGVKSGRATLERLQSVAGRDGKVGQSAGVIQLNQLPQGHARDAGEAGARLGAEKALGFLVIERIESSARPF